MRELRFQRPVTAEGRYVQQQGSRERYGHVVLAFESCDAPGLTFIWDVAETEIPLMYRQATLDGIQSWFGSQAPLAGYELQHTKICVVGGSHHETDSNDLSYTFAASNAFALAVNMSGLLEKKLVSPFERLLS